MEDFKWFADRSTYMQADTPYPGRAQDAALICCYMLSRRLGAGATLDVRITPSRFLTSEKEVSPTAR